MQRHRKHGNCKKHAFPHRCSLDRAVNQQDIGRNIAHTPTVEHRHRAQMEQSSDRYAQRGGQIAERRIDNRRTPRIIADKRGILCKQRKISGQLSKVGRAHNAA